MAGLWTCLVKISQGFDHASDSKQAKTRNMARFSISEGYTGWWVCLNKPEYVLKITQYVWIRVNNTKYALMCLNIPE